MDVLEEPILDQKLRGRADGRADKLREEDRAWGQVHVVRDLLVLDEG